MKGFNAGVLFEPVSDYLHHVDWQFRINQDHSGGFLKESFVWYYKRPGVSHQAFHIVTLLFPFRTAELTFPGSCCDTSQWSERAQNVKASFVLLPGPLLGTSPGAFGHGLRPLLISGTWSLICRTSQSLSSVAASESIGARVTGYALVAWKASTRFVWPGSLTGRPGFHCWRPSGPRGCA